MKVLFIAPETSGGIRTYADGLFPFLSKRADILVRAISELPTSEEIRSAPEEIIHLQHEYGLFGSKLPGRYFFPGWMSAVKRASSGKKWIATGHTVLGPDWCYPTDRQGWRKVAFRILNLLVVPGMREKWMGGTWSPFDGVIVHSRLQAEVVRASGCPRVATIPHYVPERTRLPFAHSKEPTVVVFGYISPEKGQDLAIEAWSQLGASAPKLVLAGGLRRKEDAWYLAKCEAAIRAHGLESKIEITGYVPSEEIEAYYRKATLVLAPFRETNGSGSLALAFAYGAPILTSDLPLNLELCDRVSGCIAFFKAGSSADLARSVEALLSDTKRLRELSDASYAYAQFTAPDRIAELHSKFYREILGGP